MRRGVLVSKLRRAQAVVAAGAASVTAGVAGMAGWPAAALAGGAQAIAFGLWLVDVDDAKPRTIERTRT